MLEGGVSRQMHYALPELFQANDATSIGEERFFMAHSADHDDIVC